MNLLRVVSVFAIGLYASVAPAQPNEAAAKLLHQCKVGIKAVDGERLSPNDRVDATTCLSYLSGFIDADGITSIKIKGKQAFCLPSTGISIYQVARILVKWAEANPEHLHEDQAAAVVYSLAASFPCTAK